MSEYDTAPKYLQLDTHVSSRVLLLCQHALSFYIKGFHFYPLSLTTFSTKYIDRTMLTGPSPRNVLGGSKLPLAENSAFSNDDVLDGAKAAPRQLLLFLQGYAERKNKDPDYHKYHTLENIGNHMQVGMLQTKYMEIHPLL